jgi:hypothetical protein
MQAKAASFEHGVLRPKCAASGPVAACGVHGRAIVGGRSGGKALRAIGPMPRRYRAAAGRGASKA